MNQAPHPIFDSLTFLGRAERLFVDQLARQIVDGNVVLFAGAGLSFNARTKDGGPSTMPSWDKLSKILAAQLERDYAERDVLTIADYYETKFGRKALVDRIMHSIQDLDHVPGPVHQRIVELHFREIMTTNWDTLIERAFEDQYVVPQVIAKGRDFSAKRIPPRIIKLNGCFRRQPSEIVVTGSDFLSYSTTHSLIDAVVTKSFVESQVLFLGFGLNDPAFRQINERVLGTLGPDCPLAFSLQLGAKKTEKMFWRSRQVQIIDLCSGKQKALSAEERILRVLTALVTYQRLHRPLPLHQLRQELPKPSFTGANKTPAYEEKLRLAIRLCKKIYAKLSLGTPGDNQLKAMGALLIDHLQPSAKSKSARTARSYTWENFSQEGRRNPAQAILSAFCHISTYYLTMPVGRWVQHESWPAIAGFLELVTELAENSKSTGPRSPNLVIPLQLATLRTLLALYLTIWCPRVPTCVHTQESSQDNDAGGGIAFKESHRDDRERLGGLDLLRRATFNLSKEGLAIQDMTIRAFFLTLISILAPISLLKRILITWRDDREESELLCDLSIEPKGDSTDMTRGDSIVDPTPVEYRLPLLGFLGLLSDRPWLFRKAAESLWSRQLVEDSESPEYQWKRTIAAYRFRHLVIAAGENFHQWPTNRLHEERLQTVLSHLPLTHPPTATELSSMAAKLVQEVHQGWIFGTMPPETLERIWQAALTKEKNGKAGGVPWEIMIILTLTLRGESLFEAHDLLLRRVWRHTGIDLRFLFDYVARRLEGDSVEALTGAKDGCGLAKYECNLALWLRWMVERIDGEEPAEPLIDLFLDRLLDPIESWLKATRRPEVRNALIPILAILRPLRPERLRPVIRRWLGSQLGTPPRYRLGLAAIDGGAEESLIDEDQLKLLLAFGRVKETRGTDFRRDLLKWVVQRSRTQQVADALPLGAEVALFLTDWLRQGPETTSFDWVRVAAETRRSPALTKLVEQILGCSLFDFLQANLRDQAKQSPKAWDYARRTLIADLGIYSAEMTGAFLRFLLQPFEEGQIGPEVRNSLLSFLGNLLSEAPLALKRRQKKDWLARIEKLILEGGTGRGDLGCHTGLLSGPSFQALQDKLIQRVEQVEFPHRAEETLGWIARTLHETPRDIVLSDLEEALIHTVASDRPRLAEASLRAVVDLLGVREGFGKRNHSRLRRIRLTVVARGAFRPTSLFAARLAKLPT